MDITPDPEPSGAVGRFFTLREAALGNIDTGRLVTDFQAWLSASSKDRQKFDDVRALWNDLEQMSRDPAWWDLVEEGGPRAR